MDSFDENFRYILGACALWYFAYALEKRLIRVQGILADIRLELRQLNEKK